MTRARDAFVRRESVATAAMAAMAIVALAGCSRGDRDAGRPEPLTGNAVWFSDAAQRDVTALEASLEGFRCAAVFFPARRLTGDEKGGWRGVDLPAPERPLARVPVVLVLHAPVDVLATGEKDRGEKLGDVLAGEIARILARRSEFGVVRGIHLDLPFSGPTAGEHARALTRARSALAHELARTDPARLAGATGEDAALARRIPVTYSIRRPPPSDEKQLAAIRGLASRVDGFVAFEFGEDAPADPAHTDSLGKPWWAAYAPAGRANVRRASGAVEEAEVSEGAIDALSDDPRIELRHDLPWDVEKGSGFSLRARRPVSTGGVALSAGDSVAFRQPFVGDFLERFRTDTSNRRFAAGRIVVFPGRREDERVFQVAALADVLSGRDPIPRLSTWTGPEGAGFVRVGAENSAPHASIVSREQNWIEVDLAPAHVADVEPGGFDRWEAYDESGRSVSPGRASRIRFYETFVAPLERFEPARLRVRGAIPMPCCRVRSHAAAMAGGTATSDWGLPGPASKPTP